MIIPPVYTSVMITLCLASVLWSCMEGILPDWSRWTASVLMTLALFFNMFVMPQAIRAGYLVSMLFFLTSWRVAAMNGAFAIEIICFMTFLVMVVQFAGMVVRNWKTHGITGFTEALMWQLGLARMYFGMNEIGHSVEKIFAGQASHDKLLHIFMSLGTPMPDVFVILAGLVEFALAFGVGCGFLTRLAAAGGILYFLIATVPFGGEWVHGYAWGNRGWEYIALLIVFYASLLFSGAGRFSLDAWLIERGLMPKFLFPLCAPRSGIEVYRNTVPFNQDAV
ncbi:DoxX family protein [Acetobacteraceae bacterium ESL0709]|nr:DoxX family protein [Acetobacteraceae bacterium ESL0697]MDF7677452.1 DoxX family protein [Acetobacteraceae bacterium ESL0709]